MKPTREQILAEPAGRLMDAWIAEYVMGWTMHADPELRGAWLSDQGVWAGWLSDDPVFRPAEDYQVYQWPPEFCGTRRFDPSIDIAAAWGAVERLPYFNLRRTGSDPDMWQCQARFCGDWFDHVISTGDGYHCGCIFGEANTPMLAICRAALLSVCWGDA